jgi:hypothetical protein
MMEKCGVQDKYVERASNSLMSLLKLGTPLPFSLASSLPPVFSGFIFITVPHTSEMITYMYVFADFVSGSTTLRASQG